MKIKKLKKILLGGMYVLSAVYVVATAGGCGDEDEGELVDETETAPTNDPTKNYYFLNAALEGGSLPSSHLGDPDATGVAYDSDSEPGDYPVYDMAGNLIGSKNMNEITASYLTIGTSSSYPPTLNTSDGYAQNTVDKSQKFNPMFQLYDVTTLYEDAGMKMPKPFKGPNEEKPSIIAAYDAPSPKKDRKFWFKGTELDDPTINKVDINQVALMVHEAFPSNLQYFDFHSSDIFLNTNGTGITTHYLAVDGDGQSPDLPTGFIAAASPLKINALSLGPVSKINIATNGSFGYTTYNETAKVLDTENVIKELPVFENFDFTPAVNDTAFDAAFTADAKGAFVSDVTENYHTIFPTNRHKLWFMQGALESVNVLNLTLKDGWFWYLAGATLNLGADGGTEGTLTVADGGTLVVDSGNLNQDDAPVVYDGSDFTFASIAELGGNKQVKSSTINGNLQFDSGSKLVFVIREGAQNIADPQNANVKWPLLNVPVGPTSVTGLADAEMALIIDKNFVAGADETSATVVKLLDNPQGVGGPPARMAGATPVWATPPTGGAATWGTSNTVGLGVFNVQVYQGSTEMSVKIWQAPVSTSHTTPNLAANAQAHRYVVGDRLRKALQCRYAMPQVMLDGVDFSKPLQQAVHEGFAQALVGPKAFAAGKLGLSYNALPATQHTKGYEMAYNTPTSQLSARVTYNARKKLTDASPAVTAHYNVGNVSAYGFVAAHVGQHKAAESHAHPHLQHTNNLANFVAGAAMGPQALQVFGGVGLMHGYLKGQHKDPNLPIFDTTWGQHQAVSYAVAGLQSYVPLSERVSVMANGMYTHTLSRSELTLTTPDATAKENLWPTHAFTAGVTVEYKHRGNMWRLGVEGNSLGEPLEMKATVHWQL